MKDFMTLEEFLAPFDDRGCCHTSTSWVYLYRLAKASFEQFGDQGPPVGAKVITLVNGHGGNGCDIRTFAGDYNEDFFGIKKPATDYDSERISLVDKAIWWRQIVSLEPLTVGWGELPKHIFNRPAFEEL
jgi:hypothetical protein